MKKTIVAALSFFMILALTSCSIGNKLGKLLVKAMEQDASLLVGTWEGEYGTTIEFTEDQVCMNVEAGSSFQDYRTNINGLYVDNGTGEDSFTFEVTKDTLVLTYVEGMEESGYAFSEKFTRVK